MILRGMHKVHRFPLHQMGFEEFSRLEPKYYWDVNTAKLILGEGKKFVKEKLDGVARDIVINNMQVFYEDIRERRVIPYENLSRWEYVFSVWDTVQNRWLTLVEMLRLVNFYQMETNPILLVTEDEITPELLVEMLNRKSTFNPDHKIEGLIVTNDTLMMKGKVVNPLYDDTFDNIELRKQYRGENKLRK